MPITFAMKLFGAMFFIEEEEKHIVVVMAPSSSCSECKGGVNRTTNARRALSHRNARADPSQRVAPVLQRHRGRELERAPSPVLPRVFGPGDMYSDKLAHHLLHGPVQGLRCLFASEHQEVLTVLGVLDPQPTVLAVQLAAHAGTGVEH